MSSYPKSVRRVVALVEGEATRVYGKPASKGNKGKPWVIDLGRVNKRQGRAVAEAADTYLARFKVSSSKKKNGWLRDWPRNTAKAMEAGFDVLTD